MRVLAVALIALCSVAVFASQGAAPPSFQVVSVKPNTSDAPPTSRFPLGPGDAYVPGTAFSATNQPLIVYIRFAFSRSQGEQLALPSWVYVERFDIEGRATGEPKKDDMRLMVRALLVERFKLAWHVEPREQPVLELVLATPGKLGPQLRLREGSARPCRADGTSDDPTFDAIPCGSAGLVSASGAGQARISGRAEPITRLAALLSNNGFAGVDRTVVDRTGLVGNFDFTVEWGMPSPSSDRAFRPTDDIGPSLATALREQLGLALKSARAVVDTPVIDHIERPTEN